MTAIMTSAALAVLPSCTVDDERDLCCGPTEGLFMDYRYMYADDDIFPKHVFELDHYLFDSVGNFVEKTPPGTPLQTQRLRLAPGEYTMVTAGNQGDPVAAERYIEEGLDGFLLHSLPQEEERQGEFRIGELYGGYCRFRVTDAPLQRFVTEMANIHCQLDLKVQWEGVAPTGDFTFRLSNVPEVYDMDYDNKWEYAGYSFPADHGERTQYETVSPQSHQTVETSFVTLRYTNSCVPVLRIFNEKGVPVTPELDLYHAFQTWGWVPDSHPVQHYRINVMIKSNGIVELTPRIDGEVLDWVIGTIF